MLTKKTKPQKPADKLFQSYTSEVYDARTRDDSKLKQDYQEDYTIDDQNKGVPSLNESIHE